MGKPSPERSSNHSLSKVVLPKPAGAETRVSLRPSYRTRASRKRGRGTSSVRVLGTRTFVVTIASGIVDAPTGQPEPKHTPKRKQVKMCSLTVPDRIEAQLHWSVHDRTESSTDVGCESCTPVREKTLEMVDLHPPLHPSADAYRCD